MRISAVDFDKWVLKMLYYDRIGLSKGIDFAKSNDIKECMVCHYWFFNHGFRFQDSVCKCCYDLAMLFLSISNIAIITIKGVEYRCIIHEITKSETIHLLENAKVDDHGYI